MGLLIIVPWLLDFVVHDYVLMPFLDRYVVGQHLIYLFLALNTKAVLVEGGTFQFMCEMIYVLVNGIKQIKERSFRLPRISL